MKGRDPLTWPVVALAVVAFAGSFDHVRQTVAEHGQGGWLSWAIAAMPEVSVALVVVKLRRDGARGQAWAWIVGGSAMVFTALANLAQAEPTAWGYAVAAWPVWASVGAAGLIEMGPREPVTDATAKPAAEEKPRTSPAQDAPTPASTTVSPDASLPTATDSAPAPSKTAPSGPSGGARNTAPARMPALTDAEALEIGIRVIRDTSPTNRDEYARAFRAVRPGESSVIKRSYTPAREAAAKPQLQAV